MKHLLLAFVAAGMAANAQTSSTSVTSQQTNESTLKIENVIEKDEQMKDIDEEITNARARAALGSKSKWSVRSSLAYQGGSIQDPLDKSRPNYRAAVNTNTATYFNADLAIKRRLGDRDSLNFGTGLTLYRPFHRTMDEATNSGSGKRNANVSSPYLEYNIAYRMMDMQAYTALTYVHSTTDYDVNTVKTSGMFDLSQTIIAELGTKLSVGSTFSLTKTLYKGASDFDGERNPKEHLGAAAYPFLEYAFNDRYSFRTVFGYFQFQEFENDRGEFKQLTPYQSVGLGISITRDFYLYPNIQFAPKDIRDDRTNVGLSANINVF